MRPGNEDTPVYSPIDVNATIYCVVNSSELEWDIDGYRFVSSFERRQLHSRQIFEGPMTTLGSIINSSVIIFSNITSNNGIMICCQAFLREDPIAACTVLIVYGMDNMFAVLVLKD